MIARFQFDSEIHLSPFFGMFFEPHDHEMIAVRLENQCSMRRDFQRINALHSEHLFQPLSLLSGDHGRNRVRDARAAADQFSRDEPLSPASYKPLSNPSHREPAASRDARSDSGLITFKDTVRAKENKPEAE